MHMNEKAEADLGLHFLQKWMEDEQVFLDSSHIHIMQIKLQSGLCLLNASCNS